MDVDPVSEQRLVSRRIVYYSLAITAASFFSVTAGAYGELPAVTSIVLWWPGALLTACLLLTPRRQWLTLLLASGIAHLGAQVMSGWSTGIAATFIVQCCQAVAATALLQRLSDAPMRIDTVRRFGLFLLAVVFLMPMLWIPLEAGIATWQHGGSYWSAWRSRLPWNALACLTLTPSAVALFDAAPRWLRSTRPPRLFEAAALGTLLALSAGLAFDTDLGRRLGPALIEAQPLVQLPLILWAALRFGAVGVSIALLELLVLIVWLTASHGQSLPGLAPSDMTFATQLSLVAAVATLVGLGTLIEERRRSVHVLSERLRFEQLLFEFARTFVQVSSESMDSVCHEWLERIGRFINVDCVRMFRFESTEVALIAQWKRPELADAPAVTFAVDFPWIAARISARHPVAIPSLDALPPEAARDRQSLIGQGYRAVLVMPMSAGESLVGAVAFGAAAEQAWTEDVIGNLRLMADVLGNALARRQADTALRASEEMKSGILDSVSSGVAVIDASGRLLDVNANWRRLVGDSLVLPPATTTLGSNLLEHAPPEMRERLARVAKGARQRIAVEHVSKAGGTTRWWLFGATRLNRTRGGAVLTLTDTTERRRAEIEAQHSRLALAHVERVATIGEMTASLAHHLSQPLTGILSNAQAARRLLDREQPDWQEVRGAALDIIDDARRAGDVLHGLRALLRRSEPRMAPVDLSAAIRDVVNLVSSDAVIRNITVTLDTSTTPVIVLGDRVQLQQLMLNLIINAFEAIGDSHDRVVHVRCRHGEDDRIAVRVSDTGAGLADGLAERVFEPFFTTKAEGMGMGLSIARSIVEAHGGSIRARAVPEGGAAVEFDLPVTVASPQLLPPVTTWRGPAASKSTITG